jgi:hypothetical protein
MSQDPVIIREALRCPQCHANIRDFQVYAFRARWGLACAFRKEKSRDRCGSLFYLLVELGEIKTVLLVGVLVFVDSLAHVIRFAVELALVLLGEVAVILGHVSLFIVLQTLLAPLQARGLPRRQPPVLDAVGDAILLVGFTPINLVDSRVAGIDLARAGAGRIAVLGLSSGGSERHQTAHCQDCEGLRDSIRHARVNPRERV